MHERIQSKASALDFADTLLTPADLVGRACRIARLRWYDLIRIFAVPAFFYSLAWAFVAYSSVLEQSMTLYVALVAISLAVLIVSRFEMRVLEFAVILIFSGQANDLALAIKKARGKSGFIFLVTSPVLLVDALVLVLGALSVWLVSQGASNMMQVTVGLAIYTFIVLLSVPYICLWLLNLTFITTLIAEDLTLSACCQRFTYLLSNEFGYIASFVVLYGLLSFMLEITIAALFTGIDAPAALLHGNSKHVLKFVLQVVECLFMTPLYSFLSASGAVGCSALYDQLTMRMEGSDLIKRIDSLSE